MKYSFAALAFAAGALAGSYPVYPASNGTVAYTTITTTAFTTYCPEATTLTHGGKTYTVTAATTLTITDCPCTITKPIYTPVPTPSTIKYTSSCPPESSVVTHYTAPPAVPTKATVTYSNPLTVVSSPPAGAPKGTGAPAPPVVPFTGAASANQIGGFAAAAIAGAVALVL